MDLEGKVAVVTGAASGIGRSCALAFAREGADVVVSDIDADGAKRVAAEVEEAGVKALADATDVSDRDALEALVDTSIDWQGHCDVFMSNAGVAVGGPPHRVPVEDWEWLLSVNLWPHIWAVRKVLPHMLERGSGHLVHTASSAGLIGFPSLIPYCVTKFAVVGLAESLAIWCADKGVGVSVVCPLFVATKIMESARFALEEGDDEASREQTRAVAQQLFTQIGIPPELVADETVKAVREDRLYVFPHPELEGMLDAKWADPDAWVKTSAQAWETQRQMLESFLEGEGGPS